jgi:hypothetical protein
MKLVYDVIEDIYDDTTQIRTMTEQAQMPSLGRPQDPPVSMP